MTALRAVCASFMTAATLTFPAAVEAHGGGLDARCGHTDRRTGSYHTHTNGECWKRLMAELTAERARQIQAEEARRPPERSDAQWRADMRRLARQTTGESAAAAGRGTRAVQDHMRGDNRDRRAAPVVEDGATFLSDLWRLSRHGSWSAGTTEEGAAVIFTTAADGRQLEVHCSPGDPEGRPEHARWLAAVMFDGEYFVSGPPNDRRAALLLGTGARMIAQSAARGGQPVELLLGDEHKAFATDGADRAAARALAADTACDWTADVVLTFDAPSTDGLRAGGMALVRDGDEAAPADGGTRLVVLNEARVVLAFAGGLLLVLGAFEARRRWRERLPRTQPPATAPASEPLSVPRTKVVSDQSEPGRYGGGRHPDEWIPLPNIGDGPQQLHMTCLEASQPDPDADRLGLPHGAGAVMRRAGVPVAELDGFCFDVSVVGVWQNIARGVPWYQGVKEAESLLRERSVKPPPEAAGPASVPPPLAGAPTFMEGVASAPKRGDERLDRVGFALNRGRRRG